MNEHRFRTFINAIDEDLLEEAQQPVRKNRGRQWAWLVPAAACFCLLAVGLIRLLPQGGVSAGIPDAPSEAPQVSQEAPQVSQEVPQDTPALTAEDVARAGYRLPLPAGAVNTSYSLLAGSGSSGALMAQVSYTLDGTVYTCRALSAGAPLDISGLEPEYTEQLDWESGGLQLQLRQTESCAAWVGWYSSAQQTQWCLSAETDPLTLLNTARGLVEELGHNMAVAPDTAEAVTYRAFRLGELTVAETSFVLDGTACVYRTAATLLIEEQFADLTELADEAFDHHTAARVQWCEARLSWNEDGAGKIVWFDVVPGLLYSLSVDRCASEAALLELADTLFAPAQGDAG